MTEHPKTFDLSDPFSFRSWAPFNGLSTDEAIIAACSILIGLSGKNAWISGEIESIAVRPPHLLYPAGHPLLDTACQELLSAARVMNDGYVENSRQYQRSALHAGLVGRPYEQEEAARLRHKGGCFDNSVTDRHERALGDEGRPFSESQMEGRVESDLLSDHKVSRYEALMRPSFLLQGIKPADLVDRIPHCQSGHAVVSGSGSSWLAAPQSRKTLPWTAMLDGVDYKLPANKTLGIEETDRRMRVQLIVDADIAAIQQAAAQEDSPLLDRSIVLGLESPSEGSIEDYHVVFARQYFAQTVKRVVMNRRSGHTCRGAFRDPQMAWEFMKQKRALYMEIGKSGEGGALAGITYLADTIALGLQTLAYQADSDALVMEWAVPLATRQFRRQLAFLRTCRERGQVEKDDQLASRILEKIGTKGPMSRRSLMRCFDQQQAAVFHPVIDRLLETGMVELGADGRLALPDTRRSLRVI
jgi:hypothetical protein